MKVEKTIFKPGTLIHNNAPVAIRKSGKKPIVRHLDDDEEFRDALCKKLQDEFSEYLEDKDNGEKLADVLNVLYFLAEEFHGYTPSDLDYYRSTENFSKRLYLESIEEQEKKTA